MDFLPDHLVWEVMDRIEKTIDRNSTGLTCKRLYEVDREQRELLRVGCGLHPANEALISLCNRFRNLKSIEITYSGWMSKLGKQLDDHGLYIISEHCPTLIDLALSYCTFITDVGLGHLASCSKLTTLKLNFTPHITGCGIQPLTVGCKKLTTLHLIYCLNDVHSVEWLEYLGKLETLEDLAIRNCRAVGEGDLVKLGSGLRTLKRLQFQVDANYRYMKAQDWLTMDGWRKCVPCDGLEELSLVNCLISPERGLSGVFGKCKALRKLHLDTCTGIRDFDVVSLAKTSSELKSISLRIPSVYSLPLPRVINGSLGLTDESLKAIARNCSMLESVKIAFSDEEFHCYSFTQDGILDLVESCPVRMLSLDHVYLFNDIGMFALRSAFYLETLELIRCQEISDEGMELVIHFPQLRILKLSKCLGITDDGLKPLVASDKLEVLVVEDCPQISERGVQGAAKSVSFKQDLSWLYEMFPEFVN